VYAFVRRCSNRAMGISAGRGTGTRRGSGESPTICMGPNRNMGATLLHRMLLSTNSAQCELRVFRFMSDANDSKRLRRESFTRRGNGHDLTTSEMLR
jgi:hypothetical protein